MSQDTQALDWTKIIATPEDRARLARHLKRAFLETLTAYPTQSSFDSAQLYIPFRRAGMLLKTWCPFLSLRKLYRYAEYGCSFDMLPASLQYLYAEPPTDYPGWFVFYLMKQRKYFYLPCSRLKPALANWAEEHGLTVPAPATPLIRAAFDQHPPSCHHEIEEFIKHCQHLSRFQRYRLKQHLNTILKARMRIDARVNAAQQGEDNNEPLSTSLSQHVATRSEDSGIVSTPYRGAIEQVEGPRPAIRHHDSTDRSPG